MIPVFVERFMANKAKLEEQFHKAHIASYLELVERVVELITADDYEPFAIDPKRIHAIDDGNYQGTLLYVIAEKGYQPSTYYYVKVSYGSCSGCDTLQAISGYSDEPPTDQQVADYMTLALHVVQGLKQLDGDIV